MDRPLSESFFLERGIAAGAATANHHLAANIVLGLKDEYERRTAAGMDRLEPEPTWGLAFRSLERVTEYASAGVLSAVTSSVGGEIVARTILEASINLKFMLYQPEHRANRFFAYISSYILDKQNQNRQWRTAIASLAAPERTIHDAAIARKEAAMKHCKTLIDDVFREMGVDVAKQPSWGKIAARFEAMGQALDYRTIYYALSSQMHNDAEELLNMFVVHSTGDPVAIERLKNETYSFAWFCLTLAIREYSGAVACYLFSFDLIEPFEEVQRLCSEAADLTAAAATSLPDN